MSDPLHSHPQPSEPTAPDLIPEATPQPGEASDSVERRRSRCSTEADASPAAPPLASAATGFVPGNPDLDPSAAEDPFAAIDNSAGALGAAPPLARGRQRRRTLAQPAPRIEALRPEQRLLLLDTWQRSGLPASDFAALVGLSKFTLYAWKKKFEVEGPAGLMDKPRGGPAGSRLPELTKRTILMLKQANPDWTVKQWLVASAKRRKAAGFSSHWSLATSHYLAASRRHW
jgi:transposase